jgi:hypothetical protein
MVMNPAGLGPENDCTGEKSSSSKLMTHPFVKEGAPHKRNPRLSDSNKNLAMGPNWVPDTKIDWPTDRQL